MSTARPASERDHVSRDEPAVAPRHSPCARQTIRRAKRLIAAEHATHRRFARA